MQRSHLSVSHLLGIKELTVSDIEEIFRTTDEFMNVLNRPIKKVPSLNDVCVANLFFENSTRTRVSFELAEKRLSAEIVNFSASASSLSKGETLTDTVQNILAMKTDMVVIRHSKPGAPHFLSRKINARIINAGDGTHEHPTQALLDGYTLLRKFGSLKGVRVGILGDILHSRVALSNIFLLTRMGAEVSVCGPPTLIPPFIGSLGVKVEYDRTAFLESIDAVNVLRIQNERQNIRYFPSSREYTALFGITTEVLEKLSNRHLAVLHPGPINRGVELSSEAADGVQSLILEQVTHGVAVRMAVLYLLAGR